MSAIDFPASPTANQIFIDPDTSTRYIWSSVYGTWSFLGSNSLGNTVNTQVIFNDANIANGSNGFIFNKFSNTLTTNTIVTSIITANSLNVEPAIISSFQRANASVNVINIGGTITLTSNSTSLNIVSSNGISLVANNFAGIARLNIGLTTSGVTATSYGASETITPTFTVDTYGRITSAANVTVTNAALVAVSSNNYAGAMANSANIYAGVMANAANAFMTSTVAGANTAVGTGANTVGSAAFAKANGAVQTSHVSIVAGGQTLSPSSNNDTLTFANSNGVSIVAISGASDSINIGLQTTGVTALTYGGSAQVPAITIDAYGRITSASNNAIVTSEPTSTNKAAPYTLQAIDAGNIIYTNSGITVPSGVFAGGDMITILNISAAAITITATAVTCYLAAGGGTTGNRTLAAYGAATLVCYASNSFLITGPGLS